METLLTASEVSVMLNLPLQRIYDLTRRGAIPAVQIFRQYRYNPAALDEWARQGGVTLSSAENARETRVSDGTE